MDDISSLDRAIKEEIRLVPYDSEWPRKFIIEHDRLRSLLPETFIGLEHYGSTAVPGLSAKPIIDILAGVKSMKIAKAVVPHLCNSGYTSPIDYNAGLTDRQWLMRFADGRRTHHLTIVVYEGEQWQRRLKFREKLRANPDLARAYELHKVSLSVQHPTDRETYTAKKESFIYEALDTDAT